MINLLLIVIFSFGLYFLFDKQLPIIIEKTVITESTDFIKNLQKYAKGNRIEIITSDNIKIILDSQRDIKEQLEIVEIAINQNLDIKEYIGVDAKGIIYYK